MDDRRLEILIGNLLRAGVLLAAIVVLAGGALYLVRHHAEPANYHVFHPGSDETRTLPGVVRSTMQLRSVGIIQLGLLLLIATPIARVAFAIIGFLLERDRLYALVSCIVLAILIYSLLHAT